MKNGVYLLLGSNLGEREKNLSDARDSIQHIGSLLAVSSIYQTEAWGQREQPDFLNQVVQIDFKKSPRELLLNILTIETNMGRVRTEKWGPRIIDIDILFLDDLIINEPDLIIPHPQLHLRRFTLLPLAELVPDLIHPVLHKSCAQLLEECTDHSGVIRCTSTL